MKRTTFANMQCSMSRALDVIGDWWTPLIIRDLFIGVSRFDQLVADLGISRNLLTERLKLLEENRLVSRRAYSQKPPRFEYALTEAGADLVPVLMALTAWGDKWVRPAEGKPILFRHQSCGHVFSPQVTCPHCSGAVKAAQVTALPGPGGRRKRGTMVIAGMLAEAAAD
jgi:DNA-binding HxlR family transcriptional regulator